MRLAQHNAEAQHCPGRSRRRKGGLRGRQLRPGGFQNKQSAPSHLLEASVRSRYILEHAFQASFPDAVKTSLVLRTTTNQTTSSIDSVHEHSRTIVNTDDLIFFKVMHCCCIPYTVQYISSQSGISYTSTLCFLFIGHRARLNK